MAFLLELMTASLVLMTDRAPWLSFVIVAYPLHDLNHYCAIFIPQFDVAFLLKLMTASLALLPLNLRDSDCFTAKTELRTTLSVAFIASSAADNCVDSVLHCSTHFHSLPLLTCINSHHLLG